jgi:hypothetical protein
LANPVLQDIEQYRMQMAGICTAAIGYWKEGDGIHPDYDTLALRDVAKLYAKYDAIYKAQPTWVGSGDLEDSNAYQTLPAAQPAPVQESVGFAGIEMWIGNTRIKKIMTQTELHSAIDPWATMKFNSDSCIDALKENT